MKRWLLLCVLIVAGWPGSGYGQGKTLEEALSAPARRSDLGKCLWAAEAPAPEAWTTYCENLSPTGRSDRCVENGAKERRLWCTAEWSNVAPTSMGPSVTALPDDSPVVDLEPCTHPPFSLSATPPCCPPDSPIVLDVSGDGFDLTDAAGGVLFDIRADQRPLQVGWTQGHDESPTRRPDEVWLALDRNGNGLIDNGAELFGNHTPQRPSDAANGFIALAEFDEPAKGGNRDSRISRADQVYSKLRLWDDANHDGVSQENELFRLDSLGVAALDLNYQASAARDEHGNAFRYRARVYGTPGSQLGPFAYDVFLVAKEPSGVAIFDTACGDPPSCRCVGSDATRYSSRGNCASNEERWRCRMTFSTNMNGHVDHDMCIFAGAPQAQVDHACAEVCRARAEQGRCN